MIRDGVERGRDEQAERRRPSQRQRGPEREGASNLHRRRRCGDRHDRLTGVDQQLVEADLVQRAMALWHEPGSVAITSVVAASPEQVWHHATTVEGIPFELGPWLKMTVPRAVDSDALVTPRVLERIVAAVTRAMPAPMKPAPTMPTLVTGRASDVSGCSRCSALWVSERASTNRARRISIHNMS